ncbi:MAG: hypothetical protein QM499_01055 [Flavobacteriaceae bacterium]
MSKKKTAEKTEDEKKLIRAIEFTVSIQKHELIKKDLKTKYSKFQLMICKWLKVEVADNYSWAYRVQYKSNTKALREGDVLINSEGRAFFVMKELQRVVILVTPQPSVEPPFMFGTFRKLVKPKSNNKK